jgi:hypothetical protein
VVTFKTKKEIAMFKQICAIAVLTTGMTFAQSNQAEARITKGAIHE